MKFHNDDTTIFYTSILIVFVWYEKPLHLY